MYNLAIADEHQFQFRFVLVGLKQTRCRICRHLFAGPNICISGDLTETIWNVWSLNALLRTWNVQGETCPNVYWSKSDLFMCGLSKSAAQVVRAIKGGCLNMYQFQETPGQDFIDYEFSTQPFQNPLLFKLHQISHPNQWHNHDCAMINAVHLAYHKDCLIAGAGM